MEIEFRKNGGGWTSEKIVLCDEGVQDEVELPFGTARIWAVFTKRRRADSFTIRFHYRYGVAERALPYPAGIILGKAYKRGYRYVHIEYEESNDGH